MRGDFAYCPIAGAPLDEDRDRVPSKHGLRNMRDPEHTPTPLTQGGNYSHKTATKRYFKRSHLQTHDELDATLYRQACLAIDRLAALDDPRAHDDHLWLALRECLHRTYDHSLAALDWMGAFVEPSCPACSSQLRWERCGDGWMRGRCSSHCATNGDYVDRLIISAVISAYNRAFRAADANREITELRTISHKDNPPENVNCYLEHKGQLV